MTLTDSYLLLLNFFKTNDLFSLDKNYKDLLIVNNNNIDQNRSIIRLALVQMEKEEIIKRLHDSVPGIKNDWVLVKKLSQWTQQISLNGELTLAITNLLNKYCDLTKNESERPNPLSLTERDLANLVIILEGFLKETKG